MTASLLMNVGSGMLKPILIRASVIGQLADLLDGSELGTELCRCNIKMFLIVKLGLIVAQFLGTFPGKELL